ncbi:MAG: hypothetical protein ACM3WV_01895 [Bacillota bacterium]
MRYSMLEHADLTAMKAKHPDWIWNRSDTHVILGVPGSIEAFKTPVEPGNSFSPGPGTYAVSSWVYTDGQLHTPEEKPLEDFKHNFTDGYLPVLNSQWHAGRLAVKSSLFTDGNLESSDIKDYLSVSIGNPTSSALECRFYLVIRSFGAAGGPVTSLAWKDDQVYINGSPLIYLREQPTDFGAVSYGETGKDISLYLKEGRLPENQEVRDDSTWASGALEYRLVLEPGQSKKFDFIFHLHAGHWMLNWIKPPEKPYNLDKARSDLQKRWRELLPIKLELPDERFTEAFNAQLTHLYMFTVYNAPRISPISYPLWWLRDGAYVVNALNKGGLHRFGEQACRDIAAVDAFGGFGSEGDAPGEGVWIISEHYLLTRDRDFLHDMYPHIKRKADLIMKMRKAEGPVKIFNEFCIPKCMLDPHNDMLCVKAEDGLIQGRMDGHFPIIWVNSFAYLGLVRAAICAKALGFDGTAYEEEARVLKTAIRKKSEEIFGQNDRDVNCAFWPTGWADKEDLLIRSRFDEFWKNVRCPRGRYTPEPEWTYFEAGQAHNYLFLGQREKAWVSLEMFLSRHTFPGLYTYHEGRSDENSSMLWQRTRGWDDINYVTPHGWTAAELFLLLRDCLVREDGDALILGSGIPENWRDQAFQARNIPTYFGKVSFAYDPKTKAFEVQMEKAPAGGVKTDYPQTRVEVKCRI